MRKTLLLTPALAMLALPCGATVRYVSATGTGDGSSWAAASPDLQAVIDASDVGDEIWVAAGTYAPTKLIKSNKATSKAFIMKDGVSLYGGFAGGESSKDERAVGARPYDFTNASVLNADDDVPDVWTRKIADATTYRWEWELEGSSQVNVVGTKGNSTHLLYAAAALTEPTVVDGFTLRGANANIWQAKASGGAVYAPGTVSLRNCRMIENSSYFTAEGDNIDSYGGAVYLDGGTMQDCLVAKTYCHSSNGNGIGGGVYARNATVTRCDFEDCVGLDRGGAVYLDGGRLTDCTFRRCYSSQGGAVYNSGGEVERVEIFDCRALKGGGIYNEGSLRNALIRGCYADAEEYGADMGGSGGGLYLASGDAVNCAAFNCTSYKGGGVYLSGGRLINSTVARNSVRAAGASANLEGPADKVFNSITGDTTELSHFAAATSFAGRAADGGQEEAILAADFSLAGSSSFVDAGTPLDGFTDGTDLAGNPRVSGDAIDCGAYELQRNARSEPAIVLTFAEGTGEARLGLGGDDGYEFSIDWGDGQPETYNGQAYYTHALAGNTVRIYGDDIIVFQAPSQNILTADFSRASKLQRIMAGGNGMTALTLGNHPQLTGLYAECNNIASIDISGCAALKVLDLHENAIACAIDCSAMQALSKLDIADNQVPSVTLPKHAAVYEIDVDNNKLTSLDVTGLSGLDELNASGNSLTSLDLTGLDALITLRAATNRLTTVDLSPCASLETVMLAENLITAVDLSGNPALSGIYLQDNSIGEIDIKANPAVRYINISNNSLTAVDLSAQTSLSLVNLSGNKLTGIDLTNNTALSSVDLSHNSITAIDVTKAGYLSQLHLENNELTSLDLSGNPYLYGLFVGDNALTALDISHNTYLQRLEAQANRLESLDVSANAGLQSVFLQNNSFEAPALGALIEALPDVTGVEVTELTPFLRQLDISYMPGTADTNVAPAEQKGWTVTADYDPDSVDTVGCDAAVVAVRYYNTLGVASDRPFEGINIVVTTYGDGTTRSTKAVVGASRE